MINKLSNTFKFRQWLLATSTTFGIFLTGSVIIVAQSIKSYDNSVLTRLNNVVSIIEYKLNTTDEVIDRLMPWVDMPCSVSEQKLIDTIVEYSEFQTLNIVKNNVVTCSTNSRMVQTAHVNSDTPNYELRILESNIISPGKVIGAIKEIHNKNGVLVTFNGRIFYSILDNIDDSDNFRIQSSTMLFDKKGVIHHNPKKTSLMVESKKYNFNISAHVSIKDYISNIIDNYTFIILLFSAVSFVIGRYVFLNTQKSSSLVIMKESIDNNEFIPYAQPVMSANGQLTGLEVLIRWNNKHLGLVYPDIFIPLAESSGLIIPMTTQLMKNTFQLLESVESKIPDGFHIGINISAQHFNKLNQHSLITSCQQYKSSSLSTKAHLVLELTERQAIDDYDDTRSLFDKLHEMKIKMAIDDFGTGHSTLSYIKNLNFDFIKIDKSFIDLIGSNAIAAPLVDNIIDLSQRLNLSIVAEGVETQEQLNYLKSKNVNFIQGYYYGKPIPLAEFCKKYLN